MRFAPRVACCASDWAARTNLAGGTPKLGYRLAMWCCTPFGPKFALRPDV